jgi:hypothetical protein
VPGLLGEQRLQCGDLDIAGAAGHRGTWRRDRVAPNITRREDSLWR